MVTSAKLIQNTATHKRSCAAALTYMTYTSTVTYHMNETIYHGHAFEYDYYSIHSLDTYVHIYGPGCMPQFNVVLGS